MTAHVAKTSLRCQIWCCVAAALVGAISSRVEAQSARGPCAALDGTYENLGIVLDGTNAGKTTTIKWTVFRGATGTTFDIVKRESERDGVSRISLQSLNEWSIKVTATTWDGVMTDPYILGSKAVWRCVDGAFLNEETAELGGEGNSGEVKRRFILRVNDAGDLIHEDHRTIQRRSAFLFGMKTGSPEVTHRSYLFRRVKTG
jgi:hypothetical protein